MAVNTIAILAPIIVLIGTILGAMWHFDAKRESSQRTLDTKRERDMAEFRQDLKTLDAKREADWIRLDAKREADQKASDAKREADWKDLHATLDKVNELYANMNGRLSQ